MDFDNLLKIQEVQNKSICVKARQISFKRAHNPKVVGSNPILRTIFLKTPFLSGRGFSLPPSSQ